MSERAPPGRNPPVFVGPGFAHSDARVPALTIAGGGPGAAEDVLARDWIAEVIDAPTGPRRLALIVEHGNEIYRRIGPADARRPIRGKRGSGRGIRLAGRRRWRRHGMQQMVEGVSCDAASCGPGWTRCLRATCCSGSIARRSTSLSRRVRLDGERFKAWQFVTLARALLPADDAIEACAYLGRRPRRTCRWRQRLPISGRPARNGPSEP